MRTSRRRKEHVEIFNFSFLDILACVIGLLIFILTVVVISGGIGASTNMKQQASAITSSEQRLSQAQFHARLAAERRKAAEESLRQASADASDATLARSNVLEQIQRLDGESDQSERATVLARTHVVKMQQALVDLNKDSGQADRLATMQQETTDLVHDTLELNAQSAELRKKLSVKPTEISYYLPRLRPTSRRSIWLDVQAGHLWVVETNGGAAADYRQTEVSDSEWTYERPQGSEGTAIEAMLRGDVAVPTGFARETPKDIVLTFVVRPDSFVDFRKLREWAWNKGFAVHWIPLEEDATIHLTRSTTSYQQ